MRIEFTVVGPSGRRDVAVTAAGTALLADVLPALARVAGMPANEPARLGRRRLDPGSTIDASGLVTGAVVRFGAAPRELTGLLALQVVGGGVTAGPVPVVRGELTIGRDPGCDVPLADDRASRRHAVLRVDGRGVTVHDAGSTNGTSVEGRPVPATGTRVEAGDLIRVGDSVLALSEGTPRAAVPVRGADGTRQVNRASRPRATAAAARLEAPAPTRPARPGPVQWVAALVPAVAGGALAWAFGSPALLLFAVLSPVVLLAGAAGDRLRWRRSTRRAAATARRDGADLDGRVRAALRDEARARRDAAPDPAAVLDVATLPTRRIWERERADEDFLTVRLGIGDAESEATVDEGGRTRPAGTVHLVPHTVDLRTAALGVIGPPDRLDAVTSWLVGQLAVLHAPSDVDVAVVAPPGTDWLRWLPHLRSRPGPSVLGDLVALRERRAATRATRATRAAGAVAAVAAAGWTGPWTVVVVATAVDDLTPADAAALADLLTDGPAVGITAVCAARSAAALPSGCRHVATIGDPGRPGGGSGCTLVLHRDGTAGATPLLADRVSPGWADRVARALAPLVDTRGRGVPRASKRLGDLIPDDTRAVLARWGAADGGARTVIGTSADGPVTVDLVADGPHALVVGTTGAGKSELLRTLVCGLASNHPPDELAFLLVDYKGGAAFGAAARLPHTTGVVTDLDAALTGRALRSLEAELRRRERAFALVGADDLAGYRGSPGVEPFARLVVVVDEFAELAAVVPEFVTGLVSVARRGRSLGLHLVLATQRPGAALTPEIRANTALRIALRVTEAAESGDVIGVPDAALVDPGQPGRGFVLRGGDLVAMQAARVTGAVHGGGTPVVEVLGPWRTTAVPGTATTTGDDDLAATVAGLHRAAELAGRPAPRAPWLPPLPDTIAAGELRVPDGSPAIALGRLDLPAEQRQPPLLLTVPGESALVVGGPGSGRTTTLLTAGLAAARRFGADELTLHTIGRDAALPDILAGLPHAGTFVTGETRELLPGLLRALAAPAARGRPGPALLLVDDWDLVLAECDDALAGLCADLLSRLPGPATSVLVAGGRSLLNPRVAATFPTRIVLPLADPADHALTGLPGHAPLSGALPGAGQRVPDGAALRIAHPGDVPDSAAARRAADEVAATWAGRRAPHAPLRLRPLPVAVTVAEVREQACRSGAPDGPVLGVAGDTAQPCLLDVAARGARLLVAGPARSGRSTLLATLAAEAARHDHRVVALAPRRSPLHAAIRGCGQAVVSDAGPVDLPAPVPDRPTLMLVDDVERCDDRAAALVVERLRTAGPPLGVVVAGRPDELATGYRPLVTEVRRDGCGVLLRPGRLDGDLLGVRLVARPEPAVPGRGVIVGDPGWGGPFRDAAVLPVQVAVA